MEAKQTIESLSTKESVNSVDNLEKTNEISSKRLCRSETDRMLAGVCGGIAEYFGWDSTLVRLIFIMVILLGGSGILVYLVLWFILPTESEIQKDRNRRFSTTAQEIKSAAQSVKPMIHKSGQPVWGIFLIVVGILFLLQNFGIAQYLQFDKTWPVLLIILGFFVLGK